MLSQEVSAPPKALPETLSGTQPEIASEILPENQPDTQPERLTYTQRKCGGRWASALTTRVEVSLPSWEPLYEKGLPFASLLSTTPAVPSAEPACPYTIATGPLCWCDFDPFLHQRLLGP